MSHSITIYDDCIVKRFAPGLDQVRFHREVEAYQLLDGHDITPKLLEIGDNFIRIEKYDAPLDGVVNLPLHVYNKVVILAKKLDVLGVIHGDLAPRNVVYKNNFNDIALIDFELSITHASISNRVTNLNSQFYDNFS
jgi:predicted Ser/Thr protein kinase